MEGVLTKYKFQNLMWQYYQVKEYAFLIKIISTIITGVILSALIISLVFLVNGKWVNSFANLGFFQFYWQICIRRIFHINS